MRLIVRHSWQQLPGRFWSKWEHTPIPHTHTHTLGGAFQKRYRYIASTLSLPGIVTNALNIISLYTWKHLSFLCITIFSGFVVCVFDSIVFDVYENAITHVSIAIQADCVHANECVRISQTTFQQWALLHIVFEVRTQLRNGRFGSF